MIIVMAEKSQGCYSQTNKSPTYFALIERGNYFFLRKTVATKGLAHESGEPQPHSTLLYKRFIKKSDKL